MTDPLQQDLENRLLAASCEQHPFQAVSKSVERLGYDLYLYGVQLPLPVSSPKFFWFGKDGLPAAAATDNAELFKRLLHRAIGSQDAVKLGGDDYAALVAVDSRIAREHRHRLSWLRASRTGKGTLGFAITAHIEPPASRQATCQVDIAHLTRVCHEKVSTSLMASHFPEAAIKITCREKEVLRWTADGKTTLEVARILGVSAATAHFHIRNVTAKLHAINKTQAAVKAVALGLLP